MRFNINPHSISMNSSGSGMVEKECEKNVYSNILAISKRTGKPLLIRQVTSKRFNITGLTPKFQETGITSSS